MSKKNVVYVDANGHEVEKIMKPYGSAPKSDKKFKKDRKVRRETIRGQ